MAAKGPHDGMRRVRERDTAPRHAADTDDARDRTTRTRVADCGARPATLSPLMIISSSTYCLNAFLLTTVFTLQAMPWHTLR